MLPQVKHGRHQLAAGQVATRAEDDQRAGLGLPQLADRRTHHVGDARHHRKAFGHECWTACPPNWFRNAAMTLAP